MKTLIAEKVKSGYHVQLIDTRHIHSKSDVYKLARQEGLEVNKALSSDERIYGD